MNLIPWPYRWLAVVALAVALISFSWIKGADHVQAKWASRVYDRWQLCSRQDRRSEHCLCRANLQRARILAVFEAASGLTTTGATVITGLDSLPKSLLFYRQSLNFLGGMGIVILAVAILPMLKIGGMQLFRAESTGPTKDSKLTPRIAETARALWLVYAGLTALCAVAYWICGMDFFDAVCHALGTLATGGFSTHDASFGYWNSSLLDGVAVVFMLVGGINYSLHWYAWRRATVSHYQADPELRAFLGIIAVGWERQEPDSGMSRRGRPPRNAGSVVRPGAMDSMRRSSSPVSTLIPSTVASTVAAVASPRS